MSKFLILANHYNTLRIFRRELIKEIVAQGHNIVVSIPPADQENILLLESYGCRVVIIQMERRGINPFKDLVLLYRYIKLMIEEEPDKVITYTIKPNIYGSLAAKIRKLPYYCNVTGLGSAFQTEGFIKQMILKLYKLTMKKAEIVFFENSGNRDALTSRKVVDPRQTIVLPGAGVNLEEFIFVDYPPNEYKIELLFVGRIMREKGVDELFWAISKLKRENINLCFEFVGWYEDDYKSTVREMEDKGLIRYHGFQKDVRPYIAKAHCVILPSYHEGMSNTLLEGAAMGRPLITSNIPGCKEAVLDGQSGYLAKARDAKNLYEKIKQFIDLPYEEKKHMGIRGRRLMEDCFDKDRVVQMTIEHIMKHKESI